MKLNQQEIAMLQSMLSAYHASVNRHTSWRLSERAIACAEARMLVTKLCTDETKLQRAVHDHNEAETDSYRQGELT